MPRLALVKNDVNVDAQSPVSGGPGSDAVLVAALLRGDRRAAGALYQRHAPRVRRVLARILGTGPELDDVVQDAFLAAFRRIGSLRDHGAFSSWLAAVAVGEARHHLRAKKRRAWLTFAAPVDVPDAPVAPVDASAAAAVRATYAILDGLGTDERIAFALRHLEGLELADLHVAFAAAHDHIVSDILASDVEDRPFTRYVVIRFTDGLPDPVCCRESDETTEIVDPFGCELEPREATIAPSDDDRFCEGRRELELCDDDAHLTQFGEGWEDVVYPPGAGSPPIPDYGEGLVQPLEDLIVGGDRNRVADLEDRVRVIRSVVGLDVGGIDMHFKLLDDETLADGVQQIFELNSCRMRSLMESLADAAEGTFEVFEGASAMSFNDVDTRPLCPPVD